MNRLSHFILLSLTLATPVCAGELPGATVGSLLEVARQISPDVRMSRLEAEALHERILPAGALPDPVLRLELENVTRNGTQAATLNPAQTGDTKYSFIQPLPFWGKRDLKRDIATAEAAQGNERATVAWLEVASRIKTLFAQYWVTGKSLRLLEENAALARQLEGIAQTRYASGLAAQQDAIRAQVEYSTLAAEQIAMESEFRHLSHGINAMLSRPGPEPLAAPETLRLVPALLDIPKLVEQMLEKSPQLLVEMARQNAAEKSRDLTYRNRYPDFTVGVVPLQVQNQFNNWSLMLEMNLPLQQGSRRSLERESERNLEAAVARKEALQFRLKNEFYGYLSNLEASRTTELLTRDRLLPQAELTFKSALSAYETGKVDFATVLDALRQIRNAKLSILRTQANQQMRLADIERLLGEDL
jgi:cobalt-zinc-cadmium efflux system outer membrane protein